MAQVRAYMMSFLGLQLATGRDRFPERFPHPFLVWEPGTWNVPSHASHRTQLPTSVKAPTGGDALCFELGFPVGGQVTAGRKETHALVINDATFSRDQFVLVRAATGWTLALAPGAQPATVDGVPLGLMPTALRSGSSLVAGDVTLRFYETFDFAARIDQEIAAGRI